MARQLLFAVSWVVCRFDAKLAIFLTGKETSILHLEREKEPLVLQQLLWYYTVHHARQGLCPSGKVANLEQSNLIPGKSTIDDILVPCVLVEHQHEFQNVMLATYMYLRTAFNSVHHKALWDFYSVSVCRGKDVLASFL